MSIFSLGSVFMLTSNSYMNNKIVIWLRRVEERVMWPSIDVKLSRFLLRIDLLRWSHLWSSLWLKESRGKQVTNCFLKHTHTHLRDMS